ncbi:hypothetical protein [Negadavirga shengliensis]|uniref:Uncharacterized protein n=1 Tax=Negadavirga shengliensis TaxID=1389218 RepID=A0ABV9SV19_9BACT
MQTALSPLLQVFDRHFESGKAAFEGLTKKIKSKKAIELADQLFFFQLYLLLLGKIHFKKKNLVFNSFSPFLSLQRNLRKVLHIKLIEEGFSSHFGGAKTGFSEYEKQLSSDKKNTYTEVYEVILSAPLNIWENLYRDVLDRSKNLSALTVNTATNQIINEEIEFFHFDAQSRLDPQTIRDIYDGINKVITLEQIRISTGLNAVFTHQIHVQINQLSQLLHAWHKGHLLYQHLSHFLRDSEKIEKKYHAILSQIKKNHKSLTGDVEKKCIHLFTEVLH